MEAEICALAPSYWQIRSVEDVCKRVTSGGTPRRIRPDYYVNGSWPWVKTQELKDTWIEHTEERITDEAVANSSAKVLPQNTILLAMYGATVGQLGILRSPMTCNQACCAMIVNSDKADYRYLYYQLRYSRTQLKNLATGAAQQNLSGTLIKSLRYPFPPLPTQRAIAHILGTLDDLIELNRETNEILEEMARALFKSWFVDFDPVRAKLEGRPPAGMDAETAKLFPDHFQDSELGEIPRGWEVGKFGDVCESSRQGVSPDAINPETPYIGLEHMPRRSIALGEWETAAKVSSGKSAFNKNEILFGKLRPYFHKVGVAPVDGVCSTDILVLVPKLPEWFGLVLGHASSDALVGFADQSSAGTKMPRTNWKDLSSFKIAIPPPDVASAFSRIVRPQVETIQANIFESRDLATLRDTLLPKLLSGEVSVENIESKMEAVR